jgi:transcription factor C subunit 6
VDASLHMPFVASGGLDGTLRLGNHALNLRTYRGEMHNLYQLEWNQESNMYSFIELNKHKPKGTHFPIEVAVQKVCWNQNPKTPQWIASGMNCGLVRVETVYSGK